MNTHKYQHTTVPRLGRTSKKSEVDQLMIEVSRSMHQTGRLSQAVTRVAAEIKCLADVVDAFAAEYGQGPAPKTAPAPRYVPDGPSSH